MPEEKGEVSCREAGRRGGVVTAAKYGPEHYHKIGEKGGKRAKALIEAGKRAMEAEEAQDAGDAG